MVAMMVSSTRSRIATQTPTTIHTCTSDTDLLLL